MKENNLYAILDLIEEIEKVDKMIVLHSVSDSELMLNQYKNQKLKLSKILFNELIVNSEKDYEAMKLIDFFIEKFYKNNFTKNFSDKNLEKISNAIAN